MKKLLYLYDKTEETERSLFNNQPEKRQEKIKTRLHNEGISGKCTVNYCWDNNYSRYGVDPEYGYFLKYAYSSALREADEDWFKDGMLIPNNYCPRMVDDKIKRLLPIYRLAGYYTSDYMTPILMNTYRQAARSVQNTLDGADILSPINNGYDVSLDVPSLVYCLNSSPGHHSDNKSYNGYCFFNNAAIGAKRLLDRGARKVCILDLDAQRSDFLRDIVA